MKTMFKILSIIIIAGVTLVSCNKDDEKDTSTPPLITDFHAGNHYPETSNEVIIKPGAEFIVDFKAETQNDGRLAAYHIEIHDHPESGNSDDEYKIIDKLFDNDPKFKNTRNATVHMHIAIPDGAPLGEYHVEVVVFDEFGNTAELDTLIFLVAEEE